jgi:hypothetical protein
LLPVPKRCACARVPQAAARAAGPWSSPAYRAAQGRRPTRAWLGRGWGRRRAALAGAVGRQRPLALAAHSNRARMALRSRARILCVLRGVREGARLAPLNAFRPALIPLLSAPSSAARPLLAAVAALRGPAFWPFRVSQASTHCRQCAPSAVLHPQRANSCAAGPTTAPTSPLSQCAVSAPRVL